MTTGGNNGDPLSGQHEGYQGEGVATSVNEIFSTTGFFSATRPPVALNIYVLL